MNRKLFLQNGAILAGASLLPIDSMFAQSIQESGMDKLTDAQGNFAQQPLPYAKNFLEPYMDEETLHLHYTFHHGNAVKAANKYQGQIVEALNSGTVDSVDYFTKKLSFQFSSHILHSIFWKNLMPKGGGTATGDFLAAIERDFKDFDRFRRQLTEVASSIMGSGWAGLVWEPIGKRLLITQIYDHQSNLAQAGVPLMVIDAWEHAYYLQYQNRKPEFFEAIWNLWNWEDIAVRYASALELDIDVGKAA